MKCFYNIYTTRKYSGSSNFRPGYSYLFFDVFIGIAIHTVLQKISPPPLLFALQLILSETDFDNIWQKCCQRTLQRKNLTYLMLTLAVGYQLKCCYGSRRSNAWLTPGATVSHRWSKNWPVAQTAQGLCESQRKALWTVTVTVWIVLSVLWNFGNGRPNLHITQNAQGFQGGIIQILDQHPWKI